MCVSANYVGSYPVPYNSVPAVTPAPGDYTYQPPVHMVPTYYPPGQPAMQPPPVMYRVPTPPNTPTSNQVIVLRDLTVDFAVDLALMISV